jgi:hypothetical protein
MKQALISLLEGLIALLEKLPQKPEPTPAPAEQFLLTGEDRELIRQFLQSTRLTSADLNSDEPKYVHTYGDDE